MFPNRTTFFISFWLICFASTFYIERAYAIPEGAHDDTGRFANVVQVNGKVNCSGVLVEMRTVLTAAHCIIDGKQTPQWTVIKNGQNGREWTAKVTRISLGRFENLTPGNGNVVDLQGDLAVLRLDREIPLEPILILPQKQAIEPVMKSLFQYVPGAEGKFRGYIVGYGQTRICDLEGDCPRTDLRNWKEVFILRSGLCEKAGFAPTDWNYVSVFWCVASPSSRPANPGDSGGAVFLPTKDGRLVLVGLITQASDEKVKDLFHEESVSVHHAIGDMVPPLSPALSTPTLDLSPNSAPESSSSLPQLQPDPSTTKPFYPAQKAASLPTKASAPDEADVSQACEDGSRPSLPACIRACKLAQQGRTIDGFSNAMQGTCIVALKGTQIAELPLDGQCDSHFCRFKLPLASSNDYGSLFRGRSYTVQVRATDYGADIAVRGNAGSVTHFDQCGTCRLAEYVSGPLRQARVQRIDNVMLLTVPR